MANSSEFPSLPWSASTRRVRQESEESPWLLEAPDVIFSGELTDILLLVLEVPDVVVPNTKDGCAKDDRDANAAEVEVPAATLDPQRNKRLKPIERPPIKNRIESSRQGSAGMIYTVSEGESLKDMPGSRGCNDTISFTMVDGLARVAFFRMTTRCVIHHALRPVIHHSSLITYKVSKSVQHSPILLTNPLLELLPEVETHYTSTVGFE